MAKQNRKKQPENPFQTVLDFIDVVDAAFVRFTGQNVADLLKGASGQVRNLPPGSEPAVEETGMSLADAYSILGLKLGAPPQDVKKHYRNLARLFHSDTGGMNDEAMKLINRAHDTITKTKGGN